ASAFQAPTLFIIANDLTKMRVLANIDEADVGRVQAGQEVHFTVDSYPGEDFVGKISQVRQAPTTINNVVTYAAEVDAPNPRRKLRQGMTAAVQVITARRESALRVPNAALRWKPDDVPAGPPQPRTPPSGGARAAEPRRSEVDRAVGVEGQDHAPRRTRMSKVYKFVGGRPVTVNVRLGVSDGHQTEVL